jgi:dienelactone hydrolase
MAAGCGGDSSTASPSTAADTPTTPADAAEVAEVGTFAVGKRNEELVDASRPTDAWGGQEKLPERTLPTLVLYPAEGDPGDEAIAPDATPADGRWPVVVFSHGRGGNGPAYTSTLRLWASAGYVVVVPTYPLTSSDTPDRPKTADLANQPADVSFLLDWVTSLPDTDPLADTVDPERLGLAGHSLGAFTSLAAAYNPAYLDDRVDAVAEWAGAYVGRLSDGGDAVQDGPPLLAVHGDDDDTVPYEAAPATVKEVGEPWWLVTLVGGGHIPPYVQGLNDPYSTVVSMTTLDFLDATLKDDGDGYVRIAETVTEAGPQVATLESATE